MMIREYFNQRAAIWDESIAEKDVAKLERIAKRLNIKPGFHKVIIASHSRGIKAIFNKFISLSPEKTEVPTPQITKEDHYHKCSYCGKKSPDPNQIICEYCGFQLKE